MNKYQCLPYNSFHPQPTIKAFVLNELKRYIRNSSNEEYYIKTKTLLYKRLINRKYPKDYLDKLFNSIDYNTIRPTLLTYKIKNTQRKPIFTIQYNLHSKHLPIRDILRENWNMISDDAHLQSIFPIKPIIGYSKTKNLQQILSTSKS